MPEPAPIPELADLDAGRLRETMALAYRPVVLRGLVRHWPAVEAAGSPRALAEYLKGFDRGAPAEVFVGPGALKGRFFYRDDLAGFNFERRRERLSVVLDELLALPETDPPVSLYAGAVPIAEHLPGFEAANPMPLLDGGVAPRLWVGNAHLVAAHYDLSDNIAVVAGGRRRFVLIPPEQAPNLYVGPIDNTIAGQPASLADVQHPDVARFPKLADAMAAAQATVLEPGDAIYIPALWWHSVQSFGPLNVLVNYWWNDEPGDAGSPFDAMVHGLLAIADLPPARREAWRAMFDHYVFRTGGDPAAHLPPERRGVLGVSTADLRRRMRAFLLQSLSRR